MKLSSRNMQARNSSKVIVISTKNQRDCTDLLLSFDLDPSMGEEEPTSLPRGQRPINPRCQRFFPVSRWQGPIVRLAPGKPLLTHVDDINGLPQVPLRIT